MFTFAVDYSPPSYFLEFFVQFLAWGALALLNFWIWSKSKAQGNMLMLIGAGIAGLAKLIAAIDMPSGGFMMWWMPFIGLALFTAGFYLSVKPMVEAQIAELKAKAGQLKDKAADAVSGDDDGAKA